MVSSKAVPGGQSMNGEIFYIGRVLYEGDNVPGRIIPSKKAMFITNGGKEIKFTTGYLQLVYT